MVLCYNSPNFPSGSVVKNPSASAGFDPWVRNIPWRRKWQPTPVFLLGKPHGQRSLAAAVHGVTKNWTRLIAHSLTVTVLAKQYKVYITRF